MTVKRRAARLANSGYERAPKSTGNPRRGSQEPSWEAFPPAVLGSLIIRVHQLGYGVLFGSTSDGGRLTFSLYRDGLRESLYLGKSVTVQSFLGDVAKLVGTPVLPAPAADALIPAPTEPLHYLEWMRLMKMTEAQIEASCRANGREYTPPVTRPAWMPQANFYNSKK